MILMLFLYDPLYTSSHDLESDYPWSGLKNENSPPGIGFSVIIHTAIKKLPKILSGLGLKQAESFPAWISTGE